MRHFYRLDAEGNQLFGSTDAAVLPKGAREVPRLPGAFERWDAKARAFVHDAEGHANARAGAPHIDAMRARKAIEAQFVAAGQALPSMLIVREAALRDVTPEELAAIVLAKVAAAEALELDRQAASLVGARLIGTQQMEE